MTPADHPRESAPQRGWPRRLRQAVLALYACALLGCFAMVAGAIVNDRTIAADPGRALAEVTSTSALRANINFADEKGIYHSPPSGVLYPTGLGQGQRVWITYARGNPALAKVEDRGWTLTLIPALSSAVVATLIAGGAWWGIHRLTTP